MPAPKAVLRDIMDKGLSPHYAHTKTGKDGRIVSVLDVQYADTLATDLVEELAQVMREPKQSLQPKEEKQPLRNALKELVKDPDPIPVVVPEVAEEPVDLAPPPVEVEAAVIPPPVEEAKPVEQAPIVEEVAVVAKKPRGKKNLTPTEVS